MVSLVYVSSAVQLFTVEQLQALLEQSRQKNSRLGITGMLLYKDGNFMQVLEGEDETVRNLAAEIERDRRHKRFTILTVEPIAERQFSSWSMAFNDLDRQDEMDVPGYSLFLQDRFAPMPIAMNTQTPWNLLMTFRENN